MDKGSQKTKEYGSARISGQEEATAPFFPLDRSPPCIITVSKRVHLSIATTATYWLGRLKPPRLQMFVSRFKACTLNPFLYC